LYNNAEFLKVLLPTLRADLAVCETYTYASEPALDCGISVFGGLKDHGVKYEYLKAWQTETTGSFALHMFAGGHYFVRTDEAPVLKALSEELATLTGGKSDAAARL
jgi:medium-chain acyl-[acyl-carrier-protein] hydrolase